MELKDIKVVSTENLINTIAQELQTRGVVITPPIINPPGTTQHGDARFYPLNGAVFGGYAAFTLTRYLDRIDVVWGPMFQPGKGLTCHTFSAYTFTSLFKRLLTFAARLPAGTVVGEAAVDAWYDWVDSQPQLHSKMPLYQSIKSGAKDLYIHKQMRVPVTTHIQGLSAPLRGKYGRDGGSAN